jgi:hypothetical protein
MHRPDGVGRRRGRGWYLLLALSVLPPLATPWYDRLEPRLWGIPLVFYAQAGCVIFSFVVVFLVHLGTEEGR